MREPRRGNLLAALARSGDGEVIDILAQGRGVRVERIVSRGQASPPGFWYDQHDDELVILLAGAAALRFEEPDRRFDLAPGEWVEIPAHVRHRVESTQADPPTVWLAVHFTGASPVEA